MRDRRSMEQPPTPFLVSAVNRKSAVRLGEIDVLAAITRAPVDEHTRVRPVRGESSYSFDNGRRSARGLAKEPACWALFSGGSHNQL